MSPLKAGGSGDFGLGSVKSVVTNPKLTKVLSGQLPTSPAYRQSRHPFIIGVAGGTASGKTTVRLI